MVDGVYRRLSSARDALAALRPGTGICRDCGGPFKTKQGKRYCDECGRVRGVQAYRIECQHPKPVFAKSGRERKACLNCFPAPQKGPRKPHKPYKPQVPKHPKICANSACGKDFVAKLETAKYCSFQCGRKVASRAQQERARDRSPRPCGFCKTIFAPAYGDTRKVFCSTLCGIRYVDRNKKGSTHRRRTKKFGGRYDKVDRLVVFERDRWRCQLCGKPTPRARLGTKHPDAPELDHIRCLADGGDHSYENTQCACRRCNQAKGATSRGQLLLAL